MLAGGIPNATATEIPMPQIGQFTREQSGFTGRIETLTLFRDIVLVPAEPSDAENAPDYRIHASDDGGAEPGPEIGAGWKRTPRASWVARLWRSVKFCTGRETSILRSF